MIPEPIPAAIVARVPVDDVTMAEAVETIAAFVDEGRRTGRSFQVATVNVDFVVNALKDPTVLAIMQQTDLSIADGMPIILHSRLSGTPLRERVTGADLVPLLAERAAADGWRILLFGSAPGVAEAAANLLEQRAPRVVIGGMSGPFLTDVTDMPADVLAEIKSFEPDIVCVALGNPKQERWIQAHRDSLGASVLIGVGGTLDFLVGGRRRAPQWMQRSGLEWIYRALQEPKRLGKRYLHDARLFAPLLLRAIVARLRSRSVPNARVSVQRRPGVDAVDLHGRALSPRCAAEVVGFARDAHRRGDRFELSGVSTSDRSTLHHLDFVNLVGQK
jgi:N-acetylglucosaminyldiphosphoundecaprenol N-acetyl-beta-D-mannosaminyltransferase